MEFLQHVRRLPQDLHLVGHAELTSPRRGLGGSPDSCPYHLSRPLAALLHLRQQLLSDTEWTLN